MRTRWRPMVVVAVGCCVAVSETRLAAGSGPGGPTDQLPGTPAATVSAPEEAAGVDASSVFLPCTPVAAYWTGPAPTPGMPPGPALAIVDIDVRPKDARLYLDDRFVGRARYLDGRPGYLYLEPGSYHLELRLDGYKTVAIALDAEAGCRLDLKHRLERVKGTPKEQKAQNFGKGKPFNRVYAPLRPVDDDDASAVRGGADPSLRPDIGSTLSSEEPQVAEGAGLDLNVTPLTASIAIDGKFAATAGELTKMEGPLAVASGTHRIEISAPGHQSYSQIVELQDGQVFELSIELVSGDGGAR